MRGIGVGLAWLAPLLMMGGALLASGCGSKKGAGSGSASGTGTGTGGATGGSGDSDAGSTGSGSSTASDVPTTCPPAGTSGSLCEREEVAMYCCDLTSFSDPSFASECDAAMNQLAMDSGTEHCVPLLEELLGCTGGLGCDELAPYAEVAQANQGDPDVDPAVFDGVACGERAMAVLDAGCPVLTTAYVFMP